MRYIFVIALLISLLSGKFIIQYLRKLKFGQQILEIGPSWHMNKSGTPTMGGIIFLLGFLIASIPVCIVYNSFIIVVFITIGFGLVGFIDDYAKIKKHKNEGLTPKQKLLLQIIIVMIFVVYLAVTRIGFYTYIPFFNGPLYLGYFFIPFVFIIVLGTVNGVNLTDGIDGLAGMVTFIISIILSIMAFIKGNQGLVFGIQCMSGGLVGFLFYNLYPAKVFMGDSGSLALGGFVAACAYILQAPIFIAIFGMIYLIECLSVIIQVWYAKRNNGKRIFKMAPIHHHYEKSGWSENKIVLIFSLITVAFGVVAYILYYGAIM